jgi:hypothetical protein
MPRGLEVYMDDGWGSLSDIGNGIDLGMIQKYIVHLSAEGGIIDRKFSNIASLEISLNESEELIASVDGASVVLGDEFFATKDRLMLGGFYPAHTIAFRKNSEAEQWLEVDSAQPGQPIVKAGIVARLQQECRDQTIAAESTSRGSGKVKLKLVFLEEEPVVETAVG